jgi:uncharacterized protein YneF (UPF0154 family)
MGNNLAEIIGIVLGLTAIGGVFVYNKYKKTEKPETQTEKTRKILASMGEIFGGKTKKNKKHKK